MLEANGLASRSTPANYPRSTRRVKGEGSNGSGWLSLSIFTENGEGDCYVPVGGRAGWGFPYSARVS